MSETQYDKYTEQVAITQVRVSGGDLPHHGHWQGTEVQDEGAH